MLRKERTFGTRVLCYVLWPHGRKSSRVPGQIPTPDNKDIQFCCISTPQPYQSRNQDALGRGHTHTRVRGVIKHNKVRVRC